MIVRKIPIFNFKNPDFKKLESGDFLNKPFLLKLPSLPQEFAEEKTLLSIPGALDLRVIKRSYNDDTEDNDSITYEGCFYFNSIDEWILEAICHMQTSDLNLKQTFIIRLPLSAPFIKDSNICLYFDGTWLKFLKNGEVLNQNSGLDEFCTPDGEIYLDEIMKSTTVSVAEDVNVSYREEKSNANADFFFPYGWNTTIGDVMTFTHNGVYHLIYLLDRRHHGSGPCGSHYICQMTSENLVDWYEQVPIVEITKPWISYGTGTMFYHNGKYYMTYGLHTERYRNNKPKIAPEYNKEKNSYERIPFKEIYDHGGIPAGGTYSVSDDGINFTPSETLIHAARNPSGYTNEKGGITLYCGYCVDGVYESENIETPFRNSDMNFDSISNSPIKNTTECPAFFDWNGYKYLLIGFTGYFRTLNKGDKELVDVAAMGENIYEGLSVPMVTSFGENRRIIAGWVCTPSNKGPRWGGVLMQRELIQEENGKLGTKWIPELFPEISSENLTNDQSFESSGCKINSDKSYYFKTVINPQNGKKIVFSFDDEKNACNIELDLKNKTLLVNEAPINSFAKDIPTLLEAMNASDKNIRIYSETGFLDHARNAVNYKLPDIEGINETFTFKILIRRSKKMFGTVLDAEIAGKRTMISVRKDFYPTKITYLKDGEFTFGDTQLNSFDFEE